MRVQETKRKIRLQEWSAQISAQKESGQTVKEWCTDNGVSLKTYYNRLKRIREEVLETLEPNGSTQPTMTTAIKEISDTNRGKPVFAALPIPRSESTSITVRMGFYTVGIKNDADKAMVEQVLQAVSKL